MPSAKRLAGGFYLVSRLQDELDWAIARAGEMTEEERPADLAPPLDVVETEDAVIVVVETPGLGAADLEVEAQGQRVVVRGRRTPDAPARGPVRFHCMERGRGEFHRSIELVGALDTHGATARLAAGLLRVEIPKIADRRLEPKRIEIHGEER